jgi:hypothetical protein
MEDAIDCLGSSIAMVDKADVQSVTPQTRQILVPVPLWIVGKLALYWAVREIGISRRAGAWLNVRETVVRRMLIRTGTRQEDSGRPRSTWQAVVMAYGDAARTPVFASPESVYLGKIRASTLCHLANHSSQFKPKILRMRCSEYPS